MNKCNFFKYIAIGILMIFISFLLCFFTFGNISGGNNSIYNFINNWGYISLAILSIAAMLTVYLISNKYNIKSSVKLKDKYIFIISIILSGIYILIVSKILPFSPSHDANNIYKAVQNNGIVTGELERYFNFYVINKLVMYIYLGFSKLIGNAVLFIKILNFLLVYGTCIFSTLLSQKLFSKTNKYITLCLATLFIPYGLLAASYIYQITIFLTAVVLYLYSLDKSYTKPLAFILSSILFVLRPTSLIVVLVLIAFYAVYEFINNKKYIIRIFDILSIFCISIIFKIVLGHVLYINRLIPYPNFDNPLMVWTQYVGTEYNFSKPKETGQWKNSPNSHDKSDSIGEDFTYLWNRIGRNGFSYENYKEYENIISRKNWLRFKSSVLSDPYNIVNYTKNKFYNLYNDTPSLYLYTPVIYSETLMNELEHNYQEKYNLLYNSYIYIFTLCAIIFLIEMIIKRKHKLQKEDYINLSLISTVFITTMLYVLMLEVSKRYTLDFYIPMLLIISYQISNIFKTVEDKYNDIRFKGKHIILFIVIIISMFSCYKIINKVNNLNFANAKYYITNDQGNKQILHLYFEKINEGDTIIFYNANNNKYKIKEGIWNEIKFYNNPNGGVALNMIYNESQYIQIKQYNNINHVSK